MTAAGEDDRCFASNTQFLAPMQLISIALASDSIANAELTSRTSHPQRTDKGSTATLQQRVMRAAHGLHIVPFR